MVWHITFWQSVFLCVRESWRVCSVFYFPAITAAFPMRNPICSNGPFLYLTSTSSADLHQGVFRGRLEFPVVFAGRHAHWHMNKKYHIFVRAEHELAGYWLFIRNVIIASQCCPHLILWRFLHTQVTQSICLYYFCVRCLSKKIILVLCGRIILSNNKTSALGKKSCSPTISLAFTGELLLCIVQIWPELAISWSGSALCPEDKPLLV